MSRKTWFITRPTRDALTSHDLLAKAMAEVAAGRVWTGNRDLQKVLERKLSELKIKADGISNDGSGGRTWAALARTFGYWYPDAEDKVVITPVANALIEGDRVAEHIQKQIMNYQIPNGYVESGNFRPQYESGFRIFPFRFLLRLLLDDRLDHFLHRDEIALFVLPTKTDGQFERVRDRVLDYRRLFQRDGVELSNRGALVDDLANRYDHRRRSDSESAGYLSYVRDSALTHIILTESIKQEWFDRSTPGILKLRTSALDEASSVLSDFESRYPFDTRYRIGEAAFARHYGLDLSRHKNTFREGRTVRSRARKQDMRIAEAFKEYQSREMRVDVTQAIEQIAGRFGFSKEVVEESLRRQGELQVQLPGLNSEFIDSYLNTATDSAQWREFEEKTIQVMNQLGMSAFEPSATGTDDQARIEIAVRLTPSTERGPVGGIIDCKSGTEFNLGTRERDLMATSYIPKYVKLRCPDGTEVPLAFFGYVVGEDFKNPRNFNMIGQKAVQFTEGLEAIAGFVMNARSLLYLLEQYQEESVATDDLLKVFTSNNVFLSPTAVERFLRGVDAP